MTFLSNWIHDAWKRREARRCALLDSEMAAGRRPVPRDNVCVLVQPRLPSKISPAAKDGPRFITRLDTALDVIDTDDPPPKRAA